MEEITVIQPTFELVECELETDVGETEPCEIEIGEVEL